MLLRVDKVRGGNGPSDPQPPSPSSDDARPLHACLATAPVPESGGSVAGGAANDAAGAETQGGPQLGPASQDGSVGGGAKGGGSSNNGGGFTGEILTVGRKSCSVVIDDKCVSRGHASIALLSNLPFDEESKALAEELMGGRAVMEYGAPSTPEEISACESSESGVICVLRDRGSKFGTYVSVDETLLREYSPRSENDADGGGGGGDETGDETDDEGAAGKGGVDYVELMEKQAKAVRLLSSSSEGGDGGVPKFRKLGPNESVPLLQLSHRSKQSAAASKGSNPHVIVLFGPQGSAIRLTLLPLQFAFSRVKKPEIDSLIASLRYVGAGHTPQWDVERSTHLVSPDNTAAAKSIMAYACRRPSVTRGYLEALLGRRDPGEDLPREEDYR